MPRVSVVVPTCRRPALLQRCLEALVAQRFPRLGYEIIVVDDGCDHRAREVTELIASRPDAPLIRYLRPDRRRGPAAARNLGWRAARGTLIAFTDDDTLPAPDWLDGGVRSMVAHPGWSACAGRVVVPPMRPGGAAPTDHERVTRGLETSEFVAANAFVRRDALERVGGFDERFERPWREDSDLQFRLAQQAGRVGRSLQAQVVHPVRPKPWGVCLHQQRNTFFDALLYKKHPRLYRERIRRLPPWDDYLIVAATLASPWLGTFALAVAAMLVLRLGWMRLLGTDHSLRHVAEVLVTSALIPFLSVYWRLRGAWHFRVLFL